MAPPWQRPTPFWRDGLSATWRCPRFRPGVVFRRRRRSVRRPRRNPTTGWGLALRFSPIMGRARVRLPRPLMGQARDRLPRPIMGRALVLLFRSLLRRRPVPRRHLRPSRGRGITHAMTIPVRAIPLTLVVAPGVGDLSLGVLGTPVPRSLVVLPFTAFFKGRCRTVGESARGPRSE